MNEVADEWDTQCKNGLRKSRAIFWVEVEVLEPREPRGGRACWRRSLMM
jgi:hypothetical protein